MQKLLSLLLSICAVLSGAFAQMIPARAPADAGKFTPVLRFIAASDTHVQAFEAKGTVRIRKMLRLGEAVARADDAYKRLDAVLVVGDLTDNGRKDQFNGFYTAVKSCLPPETQFLGVVARAHDGWTMDRKTVHAYYTSLTGNAPDFHTVIGGYHFIGLSASDNDDVHYDEGQVAWLRAQLEAATAEDPLKPVFVMHHEHVRDTVYGSSAFDGWGETFFSDVLQDFPQVVDFSGHSHYPLNDPRSLWQGAFTAVGTGAIHYAEFTVDDVRTYHPDDRGQVATCWIVEVDAANRVRLRGLDILAGEYLCEYILENPADPANRAFTPELRKAASRPPVFAADAAVKTARIGDTLKLTVPTAASADGMPVTLYRAYLLDGAGETAAKTWTLPDYYVAKPGKTVTLTLDIPAGGNYTARVVAETAYGVQSAPLETEISSGPVC